MDRERLRRIFQPCFSVLLCLASPYVFFLIIASPIDNVFPGFLLAMEAVTFGVVYVIHTFFIFFLVLLSIDFFSRAWRADPFFSPEYWPPSDQILKMNRIRRWVYALVRRAAERQPTAFQLILRRAIAFGFGVNLLYVTVNYLNYLLNDSDLQALF